MVLYTFTIILMVSLAGMLYLAAQALPRIAEGGRPEGAAPESADDGTRRSWWSRSRIAERVDVALNGYLVKFLRKVRVTTMKIDNTVSAHLEKVKPEANEKRSAIDFKEIAGQNKEGQNGNTA